MKTVIYHSADFDGIFCREIAKKFLGEKDVQYIGWNFGDPPVHLPINGDFVVMDLPIDKPFGIAFKDGYIEWPNGKGQPIDQVAWDRFTWIDHHKSSIESHPKDIPGYRIDGVAACRLAWQWFNRVPYPAFDKQWCELPCKEYFIDRVVKEPLAVRLAGEFDVWDKRDERADIFQYGLRSVPLDEGLWWKYLLRADEQGVDTVKDLLDFGKTSRVYARTVDAGNMKASFLVEWEGLKFLCLNGRGNSITFASRDVPETGHDALLMFYSNGKNWIVSLYHAKHRADLDLSTIAVKHGGGGHRGACGFTCNKLPFLP